jgi:hypothetical protein
MLREKGGKPHAMQCHSLPATRIAAYIKNGGTLDKAAMANHASTCTTQLYMVGAMM